MPLARNQPPPLLLLLLLLLRLSGAFVPRQPLPATPVVNNHRLLTTLRGGASNTELPPPGAPKANYRLVHRDGDLLYLSGHLPARMDGSLITGKLGGSDGGLSVEEGYEAARWAALNLASSIKEELGGDLSRVVKVVKLFGIVQSSDSFHEQHLVCNGASDVFSEIFGSSIGGEHARSAIGTNSLPLDVAVEVEAIVRVR